MQENLPLAKTTDPQNEYFKRNLKIYVIKWKRYIAKE